MEEIVVHGCNQNIVGIILLFYIYDNGSVTFHSYFLNVSNLFIS